MALYKTVDVVWQRDRYGTDRPQGYSVEVPKGERLNLVVAVKSNDGSIPDLRTGTVAMRLVDFNLSPIYNTSASGGISGVAELTVSLPASVQSGTYSWDLWLTIGSARYQLMPLSSFRIVDTTFSLT